MFTPQRKGGWRGWSVSNKVGAGQENGSAQRTNPRTSPFLGRGKDVIGEDATPLPPPPQALLAENVAEAMDGNGGGGSEDWKRFREAGFLDEKGLLKKEKEHLLTRLTALEREHEECLYNMGLLLIEKKDWSSQIEEMRQSLIEAQEILKREQAAHVIFVSELEKREENLKKALGVEKQCVVDLEKALREMRADLAKTKFTSEKKLTDAHALEASLEEKKLEIEAKLHAIDARLAEENRNNSEMDRKFEELEIRERKLRRDLSSLNTERKALEEEISKQHEHLQKWEKELQEKQKRFLDENRLLNERENAEIKTANLQKKDKDLMEIEEKLNAREREEIQKILDNHNAILDAKKQEFEREIMQKRKSFEEEVKCQMDTLEREKRQIRCKEDELTGKEETLEVERENLKCKEKELDIKSKDLKNWEDSVKADEKRLQEERKDIFKDSSELETLRAKLANEKAIIETERKKISLEMENLKITQKEREQHAKLQEELKIEKEEYLRMMESLEKEKDALRKERETFEREWEVLDEKRVALEGEITQLTADRETFEKWKHNEEDRLKNECLQEKENIKRELEDLRLKNEAFEELMEHERAQIHAEVDRQRAEMSRDFELLKHELEIKMQRKQDDLEKKFQDKEYEFERWREVETEQAEFSGKWRKIEVERQEIQKDIDTLLRLSKNLKDQRKEFTKEKDVFLSVAEQCKTCHNCGVTINKFELLDLGPLGVCKDSEEIVLPSLADGILEEHLDGTGMMALHEGPVFGSSNSGSNLSRWFRKCTNMFKISPTKDVHPPGDQAGTSFDKKINIISLEEVNYEHSPSANRSFEQQIALFDSGEGVTGELDRAQKAGDETEASFGGADSSIGIVHIRSDNANKKDLGDENKELVASLHAEDDAHSEPAKLVRQQQANRKAKVKPIRRTRSVKAVVNDAKAILGESSEFNGDEQQNGDTNDSQSIPNERKGSSVLAERTASSKEQKRQSSELEPEGSEAHSESVSLGGRRKRRQISSQAPAAPVDRRYNLRRSTIAGKAAASQAKLNKKEAINADSLQPLQESDTAVAAHSAEKASCNDPQPSDALESSVNLLQKCTILSVLEVQSEKNSQQCQSHEIHVDGSILKPAESSEQTAEDGDEFYGREATADTAETPADGASESEEDDEEDSERHTASIGKKIWHFFTT
ncbi:hypothetical protein HPP92_021471 [Vanilla planifolia]|uniref:Nuclear matrix constituent protein 1-like protein n=1 Tax=Vanilla planifolia TaxID=51239 RepID=A0A835PYX9_VANPL|nr:hypothetical protein HPP92_021471 [Vanilla planifolia]